MYFSSINNQLEAVTMANVIHMGDSFYANKCKQVVIEVYERQGYNASGELVESVEAYRGIYFNEGDTPSFGGGGTMIASGSGQERTEYKYNLLRTLEGPAAKEYRFDAEWAALGDFDRWVIEQTIFELKDTPKHKMLRIQKLIGIGHARLKANGFYETCSRCGGSGHYSFCPMYGTKCFKCSGHKQTLPRITKKWTKSVEAFDFKAKYAPEAPEQEAPKTEAPAIDTTNAQAAFVMDLGPTGIIKGGLGQQLYMDL
jgi:hypothetical protein